MRYNAADWFASLFGSVCLARSCFVGDSTVFLGIAVWKTQGRIVICVYRNLGKMEDPTNPHWLAHKGSAPPVLLQRILAINVCAECCASDMENNSEAAHWVKTKLSVTTHSRCSDQLAFGAYSTLVNRDHHRQTLRLLRRARPTTNHYPMWNSHKDRTFARLL